MVKVLFICTHNSARSQIAEAYLRHMGGSRFQVESAGFDPAKINSDVIAVLQEDGIDISHKSSQKVFDLFREGRIFDYVITVCEDKENQCPVFPGVTRRLHLPFQDPAQVSGSRQNRLETIRQIRDQIKERVQEFVDWIQSQRTAALNQAWVVRTPSDPGSQTK